MDNEEIAARKALDTLCVAAENITLRANLRTALENIARLESSRQGDDAELRASRDQITQLQQQVAQMSGGGSGPHRAN